MFIRPKTVEAYNALKKYVESHGMATCVECGVIFEFNRRWRPPKICGSHCLNDRMQRQNRVRVQNFRNRRKAGGLKV